MVSRKQERDTLIAERPEKLKGNWTFMGAIASATLVLQFALVLAHAPFDSAQTLRAGFVVMLCILTFTILCSANAQPSPTLARSGIISSLGGLGMALGAEWMPEACCRTTMDALPPLIGMVVFCFLGCRLCSVGTKTPQFGLLLDVACPLLMIPSMWIGGLLLNEPLTVCLGPAGAAHGAMLAGMFFGTYIWEKTLIICGGST